MQPIVLHQMPRFWGIPNASPFCVKVETWLRMVELPYEARPLTRPPASKSGKIPYVDLPDGTRIEDSGLILRTLTNRHQLELDADLTPEQSARSVMLTRLVENHLYFAMGYERWRLPGGYAAVSEAYFRQAPALARPLVAYMAKRSILAALHGHGLGRMETDEVLHRGRADLDALADALTSDWFLGPAPHSIDATVFGLIANLLHTPYPSALRDHLKTRPKLLAWEERMRGRYWADWSELPQ